mmetsp:Transcript_52434/g.114429  ORF Transcript_52434/g.114429 Transcript_52434/m.114429 type:complete len:238 (+) Transcript_52434:599-1312(+)
MSSKSMFAGAASMPLLLEPRPRGAPWLRSESESSRMSRSAKLGSNRPYLSSLGTSSGEVGLGERELRPLSSSRLTFSLAARSAICSPFSLLKRRSSSAACELERLFESPTPTPGRNSLSASLIALLMTFAEVEASLVGLLRPPPMAVGPWLVSLLWCIFACSRSAFRNSLSFSNLTRVSAFSLTPLPLSWPSSRNWKLDSRRNSSCSPRSSSAMLSPPFLIKYSNMMSVLRILRHFS